MGRPKGSKDIMARKPRTPQLAPISSFPQEPMTQMAEAVKEVRPRGNTFLCAESARRFQRDLDTLTDFLDEMGPQCSESEAEPCDVAGVKTEDSQLALDQAKRVRTSLNLMSESCGCVPSNGGCLWSAERSWADARSLTDRVFGAVQQQSIVDALRSASELEAEIDSIFRSAKKG